MTLRNVGLADKYDLTARRVLLSGTQAAVRLMLMQHARDAAAGLDTAGYVTGYRGSPLGGLDQQFLHAAAQLSAANIVFQGAINEDLAATAIWGSQQAELRGEGRHDGVFGLWYGKGPGVDRSGDALRHANLAGTSRHGGVVALMGDDHTCESSTTAHQSEFAFLDAMIPILSPAGVQEIIDYGLAGFAMSRFAGVWVGLKCVKDTVESTAVVDGSPMRLAFVTPSDFAMPEGGLNIRRGDPPLAQEARLHEAKIAAALAFARANRLDRIVLGGGRRPRLGLVASGKAYLDVEQALDVLGIDEARAADLGLRLYKVAMPWPLEPEGVRRFADGLDLAIVVEEKRGLIEPQMREILYGRADAPRIIGKRDEQGRWLFPSKGAIDANQVALAIAERLLATVADEVLATRLAELRAMQAALASASEIATRIPYFCAGCPHNSSTIVPEGARAYAGIGCHYMAQWMDRATDGYTQMGGEGANWIGEAPFSTRRHVFQNLGDGTYNHSGSLAIRAAVASGVDVTYKILFNDAVAMTGGQKLDGGLTVEKIAAQVAAEGVARVAIVSDAPEKYPPARHARHRDDLDAVQRELASIPGVTVLIYEQTCAAEKRRRRKRGRMVDPDRRVVINELVCEGCGDCGVQSNCVAIQPVETEFGRKRAIDQSACNKDFSCLKGFCPSFVTVEGGRLKIPAPVAAADFDLPEPVPPSLDRPWSVLVTGVGGTGIVTVGALIGMAAHLEGKGAAVLDMAGLAQKGGAVATHLRIAATPEDIHSIRIAAGGADLVIGGDLIVTGGVKALATLKATAFAVVNTHETMTGAFTHDADMSLPAARLKRAIRDKVDERRLRFLDATRAGLETFGDTIAANLILIGQAYQIGALPVSAEAIERAIELNAVEVTRNVAAFRRGRLLAHAPEEAVPAAPQALSLHEFVERRAAFLADYQDTAYADRYRARIERLRAVEAKVASGGDALARAAAASLFKLMAYKDEYEVARLFTQTGFADTIARDFEPGYRLNFHLAPPLLARLDARTGRPRKRAFGPWMLLLFRLLARGRRLRGTWADPFGRSHDRRLERRLLAEYETVLNEIEGGLRADNHEAASRLAAYPQAIRGFGPVKAGNAAKAAAERMALLDAFRMRPAARVEAAE